MKHLATIQAEFLKTAREWDDLSMEEQVHYLNRHPKSKRRLTAKHEKRYKTVKDVDKQISSLDEQRKQLEAKKKELYDQTPERQKVIKELTDIADQFKKDGYKVDLSDIDEDKINVTNKKGFDMTFIRKEKSGKSKWDKWDAIVQGYKSDIPLGDVGSTYKDLKTIARAINLTWMRENDEHGEQW